MILLLINNHIFYSVYPVNFLILCHLFSSPLRCPGTQMRWCNETFHHPTLACSPPLAASVDLCLRAGKPDRQPPLPPIPAPSIPIPRDRPIQTEMRPSEAFHAHGLTYNGHPHGLTYNGHREPPVKIQIRYRETPDGLTGLALPHPPDFSRWRV
jgi:hypothetical protein